MHRRMPIKTTIESRVQSFRAANVFGIVVHMIEFVRIFLLDALHRQAGEMRGLVLRERELVRSRSLGHGNVKD